MTPEEFAKRTKAFAVRIIRITEKMTDTPVKRHIAGQMMRSGTSVASNYRASCRARSRREFRAKMGIVEEECDETLLWLELLVETGLMSEEELADAMREGDEILSMAVASIKTSRRREREARSCSISNSQSAIRNGERG